MTDFYNNLNESEKTVFNKYKRNENRYAFKVNSGLRDNNITEYQSDIGNLDNLINKFAIDKPIKLYRAAYDGIVTGFITDEIYSNPDFLSTSLDPESIQSHFTEPNPVYIILECPVGTPMAPMESNEMSSGQEFEMLLARNNVFKIIENRFIVEQKQIEYVMGKDFAEGVEVLRLLRLSLTP